MVKRVMEDREKEDMDDLEENSRSYWLRIGGSVTETRIRNFFTCECRVFSVPDRAWQSW